MFGEPDYDAIAFGAHPDDVEISMGGTVAKMTDAGNKVAVITATEAELGTRGTRQDRAQEFARAAAILKVSAFKMLNIPDGQVRSTRENQLKIITEIRTYRPKIIFVHHREARHPDHHHTSLLVQDAVFLAGLPRIETGQAPWRPYKTIYYANRYEFQPSFVVDISATFKAKMEAVGAYYSQFSGPKMAEYGTQQTAISHPAFLDHIEIRSRQYGIYIGSTYGEPFFVRENLAIENPVDLFDEKSWYTVP